MKLVETKATVMKPASSVRIAPVFSCLGKLLVLHLSVTAEYATCGQRNVLALDGPRL